MSFIGRASVRVNICLFCQRYFICHEPFFMLAALVVRFILVADFGLSKITNARGDVTAWYACKFLIGARCNCGVIRKPTSLWIQPFATGILWGKWYRNIIYDWTKESDSFRFILILNCIQNSDLSCKMEEHYKRLRCRKHASIRVLITVCICLNYFKKSRNIYCLCPVNVYIKY